MRPGARVCVSGGAGAIGIATARALLAGGARVVLLDRDADRLAAAEAALDAGEHVSVRVCDVTDAGDCAHAIAACVSALGGLDVLVLSAGLTQVGAAAETDVAVYRRVMDVNFFGVIQLVQPALPHLRATRGSVVALSSVAGFAPLLGRTGYCASKHAVHGYLDTLRAELRGDGVHVMVVAPTFVESDFATRGLAGDGNLLPRARTTSGRLLRPEEVADAIVEGLRRRRDFLILGGTGRLAWWTWRLWPAFYERGMRRRFARDAADQSAEG